MDQGTPQGSSLSLVCFLAYIARTLKAGDWSLALRKDHSPPTRTLPRPTPMRELMRQSEKSHEVHLFSYVDDVNPLVIYRNLSKREHDQLVGEVDNTLKKESEREGLRWDKSKESRTNFRSTSKTAATTLWLLIDSDLRFKLNKKERARKASPCLAVLSCISNSNSRISPKAGRSLYTGCIRPILTHGVEIWHSQRNPPWVEGERIQNRALRRAPRAFRGSSGSKVNLIANVEPLWIFLDHLQVAWPAHAIQTCGKLIRTHLEGKPACGFQWWHDGSSPDPILDSPICRSFHISEIPPWDPPQNPLSYGNRENLRTAKVLDLSIFNPLEEHCKVAGQWAPHLDCLWDQGWRIAYTDGGGEEGYHAAVVVSEGPCGTREKRYGEFTGEGASVADTERLSLAIALENKHPAAPLALASESEAAISTLRALAEGILPRSDTEVRIKDGLES